MVSMSRPKGGFRAGDAENTPLYACIEASRTGIDPCNSQRGRRLDFGMSSAFLGAFPVEAPVPTPSPPVQTAYSSGQGIPLPQRLFRQREVPPKIQAVHQISITLRPTRSTTSRWRMVLRRPKL